MLVLEAIEKSFEGFELGPIDLSVDSEVLSVLGPSGCGKTTLLSIIAGITTPDEGSIALDGVQLTDRPPEDRGTVLLFQNRSLFPHMTARENLQYAAAPSADIETLVATLEIGDILDQQAATLSGGEGQRVALARALAADPAALLLDEPLANLDAPIKRRLRDDLRDLLTPLDIPVLYVTHDQTEASSIGDRLAVMHDGQFIQEGSPATVFERPATPFVASFTGSQNVFRATVEPAEDTAILRWGDQQLTVAGQPSVVDGSVWVSIRPEQIEPVAGTAEVTNSIQGTIVDRVFEGGTHRLTLSFDGTDNPLTMTVLPPTYRHHELAKRDRVTVSIPPEAIHLIAADSNGST